MKKLINRPQDVVAESLRGFALAHSGKVRVDHDLATVYRAERPLLGTVGLVSGGGSGHEPLHAGFVGHGMLSAACCGQVFTSPVPDQVVAATQQVDAGAGVLHLVKNYTGDVMNFEMAAEIVADTADIEVATVVLDDDVAVQDSTWTAGRRGTGATVFAEKLAGAAAEEGRPLAEVAAIARHVNENARSMGMAIAPSTVPTAGKPNFTLGEDEMELGVGIHGEPGRATVPYAPAADIARQLAEPVLADLPFAGGDRALVLLNGMGATPLIELYLMYGEVAAILAGHGIEVVRPLVGNYITSLDMAGCSLTVLRADDELLRLWDAPVETPALRWGR
ncbi:dihydroxyacetone kinase, N-terminal domain [Raineyella antarctica]|uniref:Dihydroxyacetone kinase, N-terminal domain n=1 Tax=Raineyella antarctica TaxID=1577474 RepID=A0A1G6GJC1_9ACTN|nr:dihydroxyacetone kinase subunit DhaK [Raineyella antarctica]SDB82019.1 dihydroxyacetone kinase, N-terminal domain [Raineyella antarctica]